MANQAEGEPQSPIELLGMRDNLFDRDEFEVLDDLADRYQLPLSDFLHVTRSIANVLTRHIRLLGEAYGRRVDGIDDYAWIRQADSLEMLKRSSHTIIMTAPNQAKKTWRRLGISKEAAVHITTDLFDALKDTAPLWMLYLTHYAPFYNTDGTPNVMAIRKPDSAALTYGSWQVYFDNAAQDRGQASASIASLEIELLLSETHSLTP